MLHAGKWASRSPSPRFSETDKTVLLSSLLWSRWENFKMENTSRGHHPVVDDPFASGKRYKSRFRFFGRFLGDRRIRLLGPKSLPSWFRAASELLPSCFRADTRFKVDFGDSEILGRFWVHFGSPNRSKLKEKWISKSI